MTVIDLGAALRERHPDIWASQLALKIQDMIVVAEEVTTQEGKAEALGLAMGLARELKAWIDARWIVD